MKADVVELSQAFHTSFEGLSLDELTIIAHEIIGLNSYRNSLKNDEISLFIAKAIELVYERNKTVSEVSWELIRNKTKKIIKTAKNNESFVMKV